LVALLAAGLVAAPAAAAHRAREVVLHLDATHGYQVWISANPGGTAVATPGARRFAFVNSEAPKLKPQTVEVQVNKGRRTSFYDVPGIVTARRIRADFGRFGRVSVFFHRRATHRLRLRRHQPPCIVERRGEFRGVIRFTGEQTYTSVDVHRAFGHVAFGNLARCLGPHEARGKSTIQGAELLANTQSTTFLAGKEDGVPLTVLLALTAERAGRVAIARLIFTTASTNSFTVDPGGASAHVDLPAPFAGHANFTTPHAWTGTLTGSFPGAPTVPLAGPDFKARLKTD
jgi:hypothetical protein